MVSFLIERVREQLVYNPESVKIVGYNPESVKMVCLSSRANKYDKNSWFMIQSA
jgi:hypothetical protein